MISILEALDPRVKRYSKIGAAAAGAGALGYGAYRGLTGEGSFGDNIKGIFKSGVAHAAEGGGQPNLDELSFGQAFAKMRAAAKARGEDPLKATFTWRGKTFHCGTKEEVAAARG